MPSLDETARLTCEPFTVSPFTATRPIAPPGCGADTPAGRSSGFHVAPSVEVSSRDVDCWPS